MRAGYSGAVLLLFATTTALQFSSTVLLSDLRLGQLPSLPVNRTISYDFEYTTHGQPLPTNPESKFNFGYYQYTGGVTYPIQLRVPTWSRNPPAFPAFAEYSETLPAIAGVDDTGILLRAFLPFADAQSRESIRNYSGIAHVLDSRVRCGVNSLGVPPTCLPFLFEQVSCQAPQFVNVDVNPQNMYYPGMTGPVAGRLKGSLEPSIPDVERLWTLGHIPFDCGIFMNAEAFTICQIGFPLATESNFYQDSGSLLSEFWNITRDDTRNAIRHGGLNLYSLPMLVIESHESRPDNLRQNITKILRDGTSTMISTASLKWKVSLCYSAWTTADINVDMHSTRNRSEPISHWSPGRGYYTVPDVHEQMGESSGENLSAESRGILKLAKKPSWIPEVSNAVPNVVKPFVQEFADLNIDATLSNNLPYTCSPCSALMVRSPNSPQTWSYDRNSMFMADMALSSLFHQAVGKNGTGFMARAVSSLITTLSSMAYYDQMPQFQKSGDTTQVFFTTVLYPQSHLGFWAVMIVLAAHTALVSLVALGFLIYSKFTFLGNHWQSIAQLQGPETDDLLAKSRMATDGEVKKALGAAGHEDVRTGIRILKGERGVGLKVLRNNTPPD